MGQTCERANLGAVRQTERRMHLRISALESDVATVRAKVDAI